MDTAAAHQLVAEALDEIAPEVDLFNFDGSAPFAAEADLDSMDLLSLAEEIHERTDIDVGEGELGNAWSLDDLVAELVRRSGSD